MRLDLFDMCVVWLAHVVGRGDVGVVLVVLVVVVGAWWCTGGYGCGDVAW